MNINSLRFTVGASIGAAIYPEDGVTADDLLQRSDAAMLRAKADGQECLRYDQRMDQELRRKAALESELRLAIPSGVIVPYRVLWVVAVFVGSVSTLTAVWSFSDVANGLMAVPNLISLLALNGVIVKETADYLWSGNLDKRSS